MKTEEMARRLRALGNRPAAYMGDYVLTSEAADALEAQAKERAALMEEIGTLERRLHSQAREIEAWKSAMQIADGYRTAPCFAELLGEAEGERWCGCPVCALRQIVALATPSTPEETSTDA